MKRARSASPSASEELGGDSGDRASGESSRSASLSAPSSSSSLSSRRDSGGEEPDKTPLYALLDATLTLMKPEETVATTLRRLSDTGATADFDKLTESHSACHAQYDLVLMAMTREAVLLRAASERVKAGQDPLTPLWFLKWAGNPTVQGPFESQQLQQWADAGFFEKRRATVLNGSEVNAQWKDTAQLFPRSSVQ